MFGSQALETAIGLAAMFFVLALVSSTINEIISRLMRKRSQDLLKALKAMLTKVEDEGYTDLWTRVKGQLAAFGRGVAALWTFVRPRRNKSGQPAVDHGPMVNKFLDTSVFRSASKAAGRSWFGVRDNRTPSYLSAKSFADAIVELAENVDGRPGELLIKLPPGPLKDRVTALVRETGGDLLEVKAGIESWFDETMARLEGAYKRWASSVLFVIGLVLAVVANASAYHVARDLWQDATTREAVVAMADQLEFDSDAGTATDSVLTEATDGIDDLEALGLPVGWDGGIFQFPEGDDVFARILGWLATALLVMLGAPFWFELLTRLVSLREAGTKPPTAANDEASATTQLMAEQRSPALVSPAAVDTVRPGRLRLLPPADLPPSPRRTT